MDRLKETDLYHPVKRYLEGQGYEVKGEIKDCDIVAVRGEEDPVVIELKVAFSLDLVLQAVNRLSLSPVVYIAIPDSCRAFRKRRPRILKLLKMLGIGLVLVSLNPRRAPATVLLDPAEYRPRVQRGRRAALLGEFERRHGDPMAGGSDRRRGMMTAYRQGATRIARHLEANGPTKASVLARELDEPGARTILYRNVYGWFDRHGGGVYGLSERGTTELSAWVKPSDTP